MAATLTDIFMGLTVRATLRESLDLKTREAVLAFSRSVVMDTGTGANQADKIWDDIRSINASSNDDLDLVGALSDAFGVTLSFARVKGLFVAADASNVNNVVVGGAAATQWVGPFGAAAHTIAIRPGNWFGITAQDATAWPAVGGASDLLRIANGGAGTPVTYSIVVIGASA